MKATAKNYEIIHTDMRYCILLIWAVVLLISESCAIINNLDVILHCLMLHIIYTTIFRVKQLYNLTLCIQLFNRLNQKAMHGLNIKYPKNVCVNLIYFLESQHLEHFHRFIRRP